MVSHSFPRCQYVGKATEWWKSTFSVAFFFFSCPSNIIFNAIYGVSCKIKMSVSHVNWARRIWRKLENVLWTRNKLCTSQNSVVAVPWRLFCPLFADSAYSFINIKYILTHNSIFYHNAPKKKVQICFLPEWTIIHVAHYYSRIPSGPQNLLTISLYLLFQD